MTYAVSVSFRCRLTTVEQKHCYHRSTVCLGVAFTRLSFAIDCLCFTRDPFVLHQRSTEQGLVLQDFWGRRRRMSSHYVCLYTDLKDRKMTENGKNSRNYRFQNNTGTNNNLIAAITFTLFI